MNAIIAGAFGYSEVGENRLRGLFDEQLPSHILSASRPRSHFRPKSIRRIGPAIRNPLALRDRGSQAQELTLIKIDFSRPGKPTDNAYVESFNGMLRTECLDAHWFGDLTEARQRIESWRVEYNVSRPHRALGERTPNEFANAEN
jgi:transposase InsO family protein